MKKEKKVGHIFSSSLSSLISRVGAGDSTAEEDLIHLTWPIIRRIVNEWFEGAAGVDQRDAARDAIQEIQIHILEKFRLPKTKVKIDYPGAYVEAVTKNFLRNQYAKEKANFIKEGWARSFDDNIEVEQDTPGSLGTDPIEYVAGRETVTIEGLYEKLPADLRAGIEKSLDLITDLYQTRAGLRKDLTQSRKILKKIEALKAARKILENAFRISPSRKDYLRLHWLEGEDLLYGTQELDQKADALLEEEKNLRKKLGPIYSLFDTEIDLESELAMPGVDPLVPGYGPWGGYFSDIMNMRVSPESIIYKVWMRAPGFGTGKTGKYRSRKQIARAFHYHKQVSAGTPREVLFRNIKAGSIEDVEKSVEQFRKAGYGQPLQKKYAPIVDLISERAFGRSPA